MHRKSRAATHKSDVKKKAQDTVVPASGDTVHGEGNYQATRDYNAGLRKHIETHDVEREARDAAPRSADEAREMSQAEREGASRAGKRVEPDESPDDLVKTE